VNSAIRSDTAKGRNVDGMDDQELMNAAMSDAPVEKPEQVQEQAAPEPVADGPVRDEQGRFASAKAEVEAAPPQLPVAGQVEPPKPVEQDAQVPSWRLRELREARETAERDRDTERQARARVEAQLQALMAQQQPKQAPDMYADPDGYQQHQQQTVQSAVDQVRFQISEDMARDKFGDEKVNAALEWAKQNLGPAETVRIQRARNPYREMVSLYDERQTLSQIGGDLTAYRAKVMDEALNDPAFMQKVADKLRGNVQTTNGQRPAISLPPSLNKATGSQVGHDSAGGSMNDADLYAHATR
jgi:hypothetical protein